MNHAYSGTKSGMRGMKTPIDLVVHAPRYRGVAPPTKKVPRRSWTVQSAEARLPVWSRRVVSMVVSPQVSFTVARQALPYTMHGVIWECNPGASLSSSRSPSTLLFLADVRAAKQRYGRHHVRLARDLNGSCLILTPFFSFWLR